MVKDTLFVVKDIRADNDIIAIFDNYDLCVDFIVDEFGYDENLADASIVEFEDWCIETDRYNPETDGEFEDFFDFEIFEKFVRIALEKNINYFDDCYCFDVEIYQRNETGAFS